MARVMFVIFFLSVGSHFLIGCRSVDMNGRTPIAPGRSSLPPQDSKVYPQEIPNSPSVKNTILPPDASTSVMIPQQPVPQRPNFPVIKWELPSLGVDQSKGNTPVIPVVPIPSNSPGKQPTTPEPAPPPVSMGACSPQILASNPSISLQGQVFGASGKATSLRGVKTTLSAFTSIVVTLDNGKTFSSNNIFAAIIRNGRVDHTVSRGYSDTGVAWYEVGGYGNVFGQITYSGNSAILNLVNGACVVQYGAANGGYPYLVLP